MCTLHVHFFFLRARVGRYLRRPFTTTLTSVCLFSPIFYELSFSLAPRANSCLADWRTQDQKRVVLSYKLIQDQPNRNPAQHRPTRPTPKSWPNKLQPPPTTGSKAQPSSPTTTRYDSHRSIPQPREEPTNQATLICNRLTSIRKTLIWAIVG
jgi:hypothetical protein